ncbi:MAG: TIM barrel protein [Eubacteriales bacterium]|nr:TIM barrel protein [Eubacteriales bacterium]
MNIGIRFHDLAAGTLAQRAAMATRQGFTCTHLALYKAMEKAPAPEDFSPALAETLRREVAPLSIAILGCYLNLANAEEEVYRETLAQYFAHLQLSAWIGDCIVGTETGNPNPEYRYDPATSHGEKALDFFIKRLEPVVREAERLHTTIAIEPVYTHIVYSPQRARKVLDALRSPNLKIILDPVNLLHPDNIDRRDEIIASAIDLLGPDIAAIHLKDYVRTETGLTAVASGLGEMDDRPLLRFVTRNMPQVPMSLENTLPENAAAACRHIAMLYRNEEP